MKEIHLKIDDEIYKSIKNVMITKGICGNLYGEADEFLFLLIKSIEEDKKEITVIKKAKKKK